MIRTYETGDLESLELHEHSPVMTIMPDYDQAHSAYSVVYQNAVVVTFGAFFDVTRPGVMVILMHTGAASGPVMLELTRFAFKWLSALPTVRMEAFVLAEFKAAHRWMKMLGFTDETPNGMKDFDGAGNCWHQYSRLKSWDRSLDSLAGLAVRGANVV